MEKVLQEPFWAQIPLKRQQNTFGCGTARGKGVLGKKWFKDLIAE